MRSARADRAPWSGDGAPRRAWHETLHFGRHFQLGTLLHGTQAPDVNGFTLMVDHPGRGADVVLVAPTTDATAIASPRYRDGTLHARIRVLQHGPTAVHLSPEGDQPLLFALPAEVERRESNGLLFLCWPDCWVAIAPCNAGLPRPDAERTRQRMVERRKVRGELVDTPRLPGAPDLVVLSAERAGPGAYGFVLEVGERGAFADFAAFRAAARERLDSMRLEPDRGRVQIAAQDGASLVVQLGVDVGEDVCTVAGEPAPGEVAAAFAGPLLRQDWGGGRLSVQLGGRRVWSTEVTVAGEVRGSSAD
jgi:hypothetical protein